MALTAQDIAALTTEARSGSDADLAAADRRTRASIGFGLTVGDKLEMFDGKTVVVLCPGRGRGTFIAAYEEESRRHIGTYFAAQIGRAIAAARLLG